MSKFVACMSSCIFYLPELQKWNQDLIPRNLFQRRPSSAEGMETDHAEPSSRTMSSLRCFQCPKQKAWGRRVQKITVGQRWIWTEHLDRKWMPILLLLEQQTGCHQFRFHGLSFPKCQRLQNQPRETFLYRSLWWCWRPLKKRNHLWIDFYLMIF